MMRFIRLALRTVQTYCECIAQSTVRRGDSTGQLPTQFKPGGKGLGTKAQ